MGYYNIRLYTAIQNMTTIVTKFGKFGYNFLPMGTCALVDILQAKLDKLLSDIEGVKNCIDDILVLNHYFFTKYIEQLIMIFGGMHTAGLNTNAPKCSSGLKDIPYL